MPFTPEISPVVHAVRGDTISGNVPAKPEDFDPGIMDTGDDANDAQGSRTLGVCSCEPPHGSSLELHSSKDSDSPPEALSEHLAACPSFPPVPKQVAESTGDPKLTRLFCFVDQAASIVVTTECGYFASQESQDSRSAVVFETTGLHIKPRIHHYSKPGELSAYLLISVNTERNNGTHS
ncbi:hypothetical protein HGRIS_014096 [Hohenbuehelia grisea]|uniref:Uncharacterized protein n=1 Tax=Hohenbuehelia grisea TaxID=104357 RepID=A0ABR3JSD2_9AGAR